MSIPPIVPLMTTMAVPLLAMKVMIPQKVVAVAGTRRKRQYVVAAVVGS